MYHITTLRTAGFFMFPFTRRTLDEEQVAQFVGAITQCIAWSATLVTMCQHVLCYTLSSSSIKCEVTSSKQRILHLVLVDIMTVIGDSAFELQERHLE
jgi:hypothetical protein